MVDLLKRSVFVMHRCSGGQYLGSDVYDLVHAYGVLSSQRKRFVSIEEVQALVALVHMQLRRVIQCVDWHLQVRNDGHPGEGGGVSATWWLRLALGQGRRHPRGEDAGSITRVDDDCV